MGSPVLPKIQIPEKPAEEQKIKIFISHHSLMKRDLAAIRSSAKKNRNFWQSFLHDEGQVIIQDGCVKITK